MSEPAATPGAVPRQRLTLICPAFNEQEAVPLFHERVRAVFERLAPRYDCRLLFVDNGSVDETATRIRALMDAHPDTYVLTLSRNFGYQRALEAGLRTAEGDLFGFIDVDCEDPPEMIPDLLKLVDQGHDIAYGERVDREEMFALRAMRKLFYRVTRKLADENFIVDMAEFSLFTAEVRRAVLADNNSYPFLRASIGRVGFRAAGIPYKRQTRIAGETHYNLVNMTIFAVAGILSSTTIFLRIPVYALPVWLAVLAGLAVLEMLSPTRWAMPLMALVGFAYCGATLAAIAIYVARIYKNGLQRPNYYVDWARSRLPQDGGGAR